MLAHDGLDVLQSLRRHDGLAVRLAVEDWQRDTPATLPRDAPIAALLRHRRDAVLAHRRQPLHLVDRLQSLVAEARDRREPLRRGALDHGLLRAPVVRVAVRVLLRQEQRRAEALLHLGAAIAIHNAQARQAVARLGGELALAVDGRERLEAVLDARLVVVHAVPRCRVHEARAALRGDVVAADDDARQRGHAVRNRARVSRARRQLGALERRHRRQSDAKLLGERVGEGGGDDELAAGHVVVLCVGGGESLNDDIVQIFVHRHGQVRR
mmetsp:Transcript_16401/g.55355  ORF Transcript_16401/g.55355 Transcript_16401/m.55355 type:complete len:269 (+) Transcript_16401:1879-2685(+)